MKKILAFLIIVFLSLNSFSQEFNVDLQLRPKYEFRNGYKKFLSENETPASHISQRSRINFNFKNEKIGAKLSLQNVRVWGDVPISTSEDKYGIAVFEAYGEYFHNGKLHFRVGRQTLAYDNQRIFGISDWSQKAQSHDLFRISLLPAYNSKLDLGVAVNAEDENLYQTGYQVNNYKNLQYAWYHRTFSSLGVSLLLLNTGYEFETSAEEFEAQYLQTFGSYINFKKEKWSADFSVYAQTGEKTDKKVTAVYAGTNLSYKVKPTMDLGFGAEYLSGTDMDEPAGNLHSFTPLFGTNHGFNGAMDYFYVGNHLNSVGLINPYLKFNYSKEKFASSIVPHLFFAEADVINSENKKMDSYLGAEIDFSASYKISLDLKLDLGYSQIFGTETLEFLKQKNASGVQNWAWVKVTFHPIIFSSEKKQAIGNSVPSI